MPDYRRFRSSRDAIRQPRAGVFVSGIRDDFALDGAKYGLNPARLARALRAADGGDTRSLFDIYGAVEEDPHVHAVLGKRRRAVASRELSITPVPSANGEVSEPAQRAADLCNAVIFGNDQRGGMQGWQESLYDLTDAIGKGFSLLQIVWASVDGQWRPLKLEHWPQRETILGDPLTPFGQDADTVRVLTDDDQVRGRDLEPWAWICHRHKSRSDILARSALLRSVVWWYLFKRFSAKDWTIFAERYGMPLRLGKYAPGSDDESRKALKKAVIELGKDAGAILEEGQTIEFVETKLSGALPYEMLIKTCNTEMSKSILGTTLTTEVGSTGGNRSLGEVHERSENDLVEADARAIATTIREQLFAPIVLFNEGPDVPVPYADFLSQQDDAQKERAERDEILVRGIGLQVPSSYFYETYDVPKPEGDEDVVTPPVKKVTSEEDIEDEDAAEATAEVEAAAASAGLSSEQRAVILELRRSRGRDIALEYVFALADRKKKSARWAM